MVGFLPRVNISTLWTRLITTITLRGRHVRKFRPNILPQNVPRSTHHRGLRICNRTNNLGTFFLGNTIVNVTSSLLSHLSRLCNVMNRHTIHHANCRVRNGMTHFILQRLCTTRLPSGFRHPLPRYMLLQMRRPNLQRRRIKRGDTLFRAFRHGASIIRRQSNTFTTRRSTLLLYHRQSTLNNLRRLQNGIVRRLRRLNLRFVLRVMRLKGTTFISRIPQTTTGPGPITRRGNFPTIQRSRQRHVIVRCLCDLRHHAPPLPYHDFCGGGETRRPGKYHYHLPSSTRT